MNAQNNNKLNAGSIAQTGALVSAVLASACCWLPLLLIAFGVSGGALSAKFEALRPVLLPVTFVLLGLAFYFAYRKPKTVETEASGSGEACCAIPAAANATKPCCPPEGNRGFNLKRLNKLMLWVVTVLVLAFSFFPNYVGLLLGSGDTASTQIDANRVEWTMAVEGMTCQGCAALIESELRKVPGVAEVNVDYEKGSAMVAAAPSVSEADLRRAIENAGYSISSATKKLNEQGDLQ